MKELDKGAGSGVALGDFLASDEDGVGFVGDAYGRVRAQRERWAREMADKAARLARPVKDEATANVADSHVARVVVDGRRLRFGYGIERQVTKGHLPVAALRACEKFRLDWEAANKGGAIAVIDPMRVRVDSSVRNYETTGGRVDMPVFFRAACAAIGPERSAQVFVAVHCICEGKLLKDAAGVLAAKGFDGDPRKVTAMLVEAARRLVAHYKPQPATREGLTD
jgi:hypothetical protein